LILRRFGRRRTSIASSVFSKELGDVLNRTVLLTDENSIDAVYYRYEPHTLGPEAVD
jgi:hypothetical protein